VCTPAGAEDVRVSVEGAAALGIVVGAESLIDNQPDHRIVSAVASHLQNGQASAARLPPER
jgi:hypothetical protein